MNQANMSSIIAANSRAINYLKNSKINTYTSDYIVQVLSQDSLVKLQQFMKKNKTFKITGFMRFIRELLPFDKNDNSQETQFFIFHAIFKLFQEICNSKKSTDISFSDISSYIAQKMPNFTRQNKIQQKLLPLGLNIDQRHKSGIIPPEIFGQMVQDRCFLTLRPIKSDLIQHLGRDVGQSQYSKKFNLYFSMDKPSDIITIYDDDFNALHTLKTEQQMTKRDMIVNFIAWSDREEKIACILGNYSISMWSKQDNYKYEVNVPLPGQYLAHPFVIIKYMDSMRKWITLDNRPAVYVLDNRNYQPEFTFNNLKIRKKKQSQKIYLTELCYVQLLCIGFQRNVFLVSLKNKQIVSQVHNFRTSITSIAFSESYQALFISTYQKYFRSYELSEFQDLMERGSFEGHKSQISLLGVIEQKPIVFSVQQNSILKLFDMRSYTCYQSFSVLKNILYKQVLYLNDAICLVGSKMHVYGIQKQLTYKQKQYIIYIGNLYKDLLVVTNKCVKVYDIRNGALKSVIKAIFGDTQNACDIFSVYVMHTKQKLLIQSQQGECVILQTKQMSQIENWKLEPKPFYMQFDEQYDLLTQVSLGNVYINQFHNQYCQKQMRRQIINNNDVVRFIKVSPKHDLIALCYEQDQNLYFYAYEKGKNMGYLNFGQKKIIKFKNAYKPHKTIHKIIDVQFYQNKNLIVILLSNQLVVLTYKRSISTLTFFVKKQVKLWQNPLKLADNTEYKYNQKQFEEPLFSTGFAFFDNKIAISSNRINIFSYVEAEFNKIGGVQQYIIVKDNFNPTRIGNEVHNGAIDFKNPMVTIKDLSQANFIVSYQVFKQKFGHFAKCAKVGNLFAIADNQLNIILLQNPNWNKISGHINSEETLPKSWEIFKYSQQQIKQVQFILNFLENQYKFPPNLLVKSLVEQNNSIREIKQRNIANITLSQLILEDQLKGGSMKTFRSCSLREKKMVLQKQRQEKARVQNYLQQQKIISKEKPNNSLKDNAQKQINETLGYLSINHNQTILKKGVIEQDIPAVRALQRKLNASINKEQKKSLISYKTGQQSIKTKRVDLLAITPVRQLKMAKTISTQIYENLTQKIGLKSYSSRQLIQKLNLQKNHSQRKLKPISTHTNIFPKISKFE